MLFLWWVSSSDHGCDILIFLIYQHETVCLGLVPHSLRSASEERIGPMIIK